MVSKNKRKAFTLTELLVVVVIVGVLSAVALPRFNRAIETRKTGEAEELMAAVRTEQEKRCTLDQNYTTKLEKLSQIIASGNTKNYTYSLQKQGISAASTGGGYTLKILSYRDGTFCCDGAGCDKLNKNYPRCSQLTPTASACAEEEEVVPECTEGATSGSQSCNGCGTRTTQRCVGGKWTSSLGSCSKTVSECNPAECTEGDTRGEQSCNDCGTQTTEKCIGGKWTSSLGSCSKTTEECQPAPPVVTECNPGEKQTGSACGNCGQNTRTCDAKGNWGAWACSNEKECAAGTTEESACDTGNGSKTRTCSQQCIWEDWDDSTCVPDCPEGKTWDGNACVCEDQAAKAACTDKLGFVTPGGSTGGLASQLKRVTIHYEWDDETCSCSCPSFGNSGHCDYSSGMMVKLGEWDSQTCNCKAEEVQPYYFKCVSRIVSQSGGLLADGKYSSKGAAQKACLSGEDPSASFNAYLSGGGTDPNCRPTQSRPGGPWTSCPILPAYYIKWQCSTEPPRAASGYGFDEIQCVVVIPHN